jgi:hypothetical protein
VLCRSMFSCAKFLPADFAETAERKYIFSEFREVCRPSKL